METKTQLNRAGFGAEVCEVRPRELIVQISRWEGPLGNENGIGPLLGAFIEPWLCRHKH